MHFCTSYSYLLYSSLQWQVSPQWQKCEMNVLKKNSPLRTAVVFISIFCCLAHVLWWPTSCILFTSDQQVDETSKASLFLTGGGNDTGFRLKRKPERRGGATSAFSLYWCIVVCSESSPLNYFRHLLQLFPDVSLNHLLMSSNAMTAPSMVKNKQTNKHKRCIFQLQLLLFVA